MKIDINEAERQVVGIALRDPAVLADLSDLYPTHFTTTPLGLLWGVLTMLRDAGEYSGDITVVVREMRRQGLYEMCGGSGSLAELVRSAGLSSYAKIAADDILADAERRRMLGVMVKAVMALEDSGADVDAIRGRVDAELGAFAGASSGVASLSELIAEILAAAYDPNPGSPGIETGLSSFDAATGGLHPGELVIVAARPSVGKSALGAGFGLHAAMQGHRALFVSLEMTGRDVAARMLAAESGESFASIRSGIADTNRLASASGAFAGLPFRIWSGRRLTTEKLRAVCRLEQSRGGLDLVIVDYIGLLTPTDKRKPRWEAVTEMSNDLKSLALSMGVPVVALCQLNRDAEGKQPELSHLRESGSIEQDADVVALLHRDRDSDLATLNIAKIRNGRPGAIELHFEQRATRFTEARVEQHAGYSEEFSEYSR